MEIPNDIKKAIEQNSLVFFYGNVGRCLESQGKFEFALNCLVKSFNLIERGSSHDKLLNLGYAALWIAQILEQFSKQEPALYFSLYAKNIWKNTSPPLANKVNLKNNDSVTALSILSAEHWKLEKYCLTWCSDNMV